MKNLYLLALASLFIFSCAPEQPSIELDELSISEIHLAYSAKEYTSEELVKAYISRIETSDSLLNAITFLNPKAIIRAKQLDQEFIRTGKLKPLHGIPVLVKDNINTQGLPTTAGALALADFIPETDAFIIQKLEEAGAIILAKTNMAEWAFSPMHSESSTEGTTRNPYNLDHVPAGSSGGTGAGIAANFGTTGLGTDTGNSIRGPSSHNALVGFRTSLGLISREGIVPLYLRNDVVGPMTRTVEDAARMLDVIAGSDAKDPITAKSNGKIPESYQAYLDKNGLQGARIGVFRTLSENDPNSEISALFNQALADMEKLGAVIVDSVEVENFGELRQNQWCDQFQQDLEDFLQTYVKRDTMATLEDVIRVGTASDFVRARMPSLNEKNETLDERPCGDAFSDPRRIAFREAIEKTMDSLNLDALVYPSWNHPAARIDRFQEEYRGDNSQIIAPHTGQPAFTVPMGFVSGNLPAGLQFLGRMFDEGTLIRLTYAYEQGTNHRKAPN